MNQLTKRSLCFVSVGIVVALSGASLRASTLAYEVTGASGFGTLDLGTGVYTQINGAQTQQLVGLGVLNGVLYGVAGNTLYTVNPTNGNLTSAGSGSVTYLDFGSTLNGLFAIGSDSNLYSVTSSGVATKVGAGLGVNVNGNTIGLSTNSNTLYYALGPNTLYTLDTTTGIKTEVGTFGNPGVPIGAMLLEAGSLYAGVDPAPSSIDTLNTSTAVATAGPGMTGSTAAIYGLAPDPLPAASGTPEPGTWVMLAGGIGAFAFFRRYSASLSPREPRRT